MKRVVIDTNILIAWQKSGKLTGADEQTDVVPLFSVMTQIEALGYRNLTATSERAIESILGIGQVVGLEAEVVAETIRIRQQVAIKTPDAIIAATALCYDAELWTANTDDFKNVIDLKLYNPLI